MSIPADIIPYARHYDRRAKVLRDVLRSGAAKGVDLNADGLMLVAMSIRSMTTEYGPVTPLRDVLAKVEVKGS